MKLKLLCLLGLSFVLSFNAQAEDQTRLSIRPAILKRCSDNLSSNTLLSMVADQQRISEDATDVSFDFILSLGNCVNNLFHPVDLSTNQFSFRVFVADQAYTTYRTFSGIKTTTELLEPSVMRIQIDVKKDKLFKEDPYNAVKYLIIQPYGMFNSSYTWILTFRRSTNGSTSLKISYQ